MPGRYRRSWVVLGIVALLVVAAFVVFRTATAGQTFDPALDPNFAPGDASVEDTPADVDPTEGGLPSEG